MMHAVFTVRTFAATRRRLAGLLPLCLVALAALAAGPSHAGGFPDRPLKLVVGFPPGGGGDLYGRMIAEALGKRIGKPIIVENRPGAGGIIAAEFVAKSPADGYTLLLAMTSNMSLAPVVQPATLPYKVPDDFTMIGMAVEAPHGMFVASNSPFKDARQVLAAAKARSLTYGNTGRNSVGNTAMLMIQAKAGVKMLSVPYRGSGPAITDLLGGQIDTFFATAPPLMGQVKGGKVRLLAMTGEHRNPGMPGVPTFRELGVDVTVTQWYGVAAPAGTPPEIAKVLSGALSDVVRDAAFERRVAQDGAVATDIPGDRFRDYIVQDTETYRTGLDDKALKSVAAQR
jgi:tripartite-type tricarboxylate transporter receptor subunit TctC